jgi:hypothetical protein
LTDNQSKSITVIKDGKDVIVGMKMGSGKSLTYESIPVVFPGSCVVIFAPLISIMSEQCKKLEGLESIFRAFKRKEMKASRRLAENDIITRGLTVKIQQVAVHGNYENPSNEAKDRNPWLAKMQINMHTSCITYKPSLCDLENLSNDAKGEDE